jgi:hypothetical protein
MSKSEIIELFKNEIVHLNKVENYKSMYAEIGLNDYKIGNFLYNVRFLMDRSSGLLVQVNISKSPNNPLVKNATRADYDVLERLLFDKYGKWSYKSEDKEPDKRVSRGVVIDGTTSIKTTWNFKSSTIELTYLELDSNIPPILTLSYKKKIASTTKDKL